MNPLSKDELLELLNRAVRKDVYLVSYDIEIAEYEALMRFSAAMHESSSMPLNW